ncbi:hypothetical protein LWI28_013594 [Acer negundo]|uniref:Uncharacterized protein n=1 Tax=Acer negundo TaxID=4023 RepID=A0AAD5IHR0_ACENE|nr:hypothetical protein LWI28_013594 [Acer negundo]
MVSASIEETNALLNWKASFANQTQSLLPSWNLLSHNPCTWFGISCNSAGSVNNINITSFGLNGTLHKFSFSSFPNLKYLDLAINSLFGIIPSQIAVLSKLIYLDLSTNHFSGQIPQEIGLLTNLQVLHLVGNQLNGSIPDEIGRLKSLEELALHSNQLHGPIPVSLGNLNNLTYLYLENNSLSGSIPQEFGNLKNLLELYIDTNNLTGPIPTTLGNLNKLTVLFAFQNNLSGPIPHEIGNLISLTILYLRQNQFSGSIPTSFGNLINLEVLSLNHNKLSSSIPQEIGNLMKLRLMTLNNNQFNGMIPYEIGKATQLQYINFSNNQLFGSIPSEFGLLTNLVRLDLSGNNLNKEIPHSICNGLHDRFSAIRSQILLMEPFPSIQCIYSLVRQEEKQQEINVSIAPTIDSAALHVRSSVVRPSYHSSKRPRPFCEHCNRHGHTKATYYKIHGYPSKQKDTINDVPQREVIDVIPPAQVSLTTEQYTRLLTFLSTDGSTIPTANLAAQRLQLASVYKGEAEKILLVKKAEAEAEAKYLGGVGVARQRQAITDGLRENILNFSHKVEGTTAKEVMDLIMVTQYFDTIKDLGNSSKNTTVFIPHGPGHVRDITDQLRNGLMEASSAQINAD